MHDSAGEGGMVMVCTSVLHLSLNLYFVAIHHLPLEIKVSIGAHFGMG
jgi:hypothetical protein